MFGLVLTIVSKGRFISSLYTQYINFGTYYVYIISCVNGNQNKRFKVVQYSNKPHGLRRIHNLLQVKAMVSNVCACSITAASLVTKSYIELKQVLPKFGIGEIITSS